MPFQIHNIYLNINFTINKIYYSIQTDISQRSQKVSHFECVKTYKLYEKCTSSQINYWNIRRTYEIEFEPKESRFLKETSSKLVLLLNSTFFPYLAKSSNITAEFFFYMTSVFKVHWHLVLVVK